MPSVRWQNLGCLILITIKITLMIAIMSFIRRWVSFTCSGESSIYLCHFLFCFEIHNVSIMLGLEIKTSTFISPHSSTPPPQPPSHPYIPYICVWYMRDMLICLVLNLKHPNYFLFSWLSVVWLLILFLILFYYSDFLF